MPKVFTERIDSPLHVNLRSRHHLAPSLSSRPPAVSSSSKDRPSYPPTASESDLLAPTGREEEVYVCKGCKSQLCTSRDIVSQHFHGKHGKAFLSRRCANSYFGAAEQKMLMTGLHIVRNVYCGGVGGNVVVLSDQADVTVEEIQLRRLVGSRGSGGEEGEDNDDQGRQSSTQHNPPFAPPPLYYSNNPHPLRHPLTDQGAPLGEGGSSVDRTPLLSSTPSGTANGFVTRDVTTVPAVPCGRLLGWTYDYAHEKQQVYKTGKFVIEQEHVETIW